MQFFFLHLSFLLILVCIITSCKDSHQKNKAPLFDDIGHFHHAIKTQYPLAQRYFDQGLTLLYSFEYAEAIRSFAAATKIDPTCAMCYWGLALSLGSKTNTPLNGHELKDAEIAINHAAKYVDKNNLTERLYITSLTTRYKNITPQQLNDMSGLCGVSSVSSNNAKNYFNAMKRLVRFLPEDPDVKSLYAAAYIDSVEWKFWKENGKPYPHTLETIKVLEDALKIDPNHPGANHFYIHMVEGSPVKKKSLPSAIRLGQLVPVSEHMEHMPCHTYYSLGDYHKAVVVNQRAIQRFKNYAKTCEAQGFAPEPQFLYFHNYDFLMTAANMEGNKSLALSAASELNELVTPWLKDTPFLQKLQTPAILTLARFGLWEDIMRLPVPPTDKQFVLAIWHYARTLAQIELNQLEAAKQELQTLQYIVNQGSSIKNLGKYGHTLLKISDLVLEGLLAEKNKDKVSMLKNYSQGIALQDSFYYSDPPAWYFPLRELQGISLLRLGYFEDAKKIFLEDLKRNPGNAWSLYGLFKCEEALKNANLAKEAYEKFKKAWQYADIPIPIFM